MLVGGPTPWSLGAHDAAQGECPFIFPPGRLPGSPRVLRHQDWELPVIAHHVEILIAKTHCLGLRGGDGALAQITETQAVHAHGEAPCNFGTLFSRL